MAKMKSDLLDAQAVFLTGDLSQDETLESYQIIVDSLKEFHQNIYWIPGNHDSIENMQEIFGKQANFIRTNRFTTAIWDFIFLNTKQNGTAEGFISPEDYLSLELELKKSTSKPVALVMHHHPVAVKTPLIDQYILKNNQKLLDLIDDYKVNLVICGHVHGDYSIRYGNAQIESAPATCFQFKKGAEKLDVEPVGGYKLYYFSKDQYVSETKTWPI